MKTRTQTLDDVAKQAIQDRSVIDHLIAALGPVAGNTGRSEAAAERSVEIYHQIRRTWSVYR